MGYLWEEELRRKLKSKMYDVISNENNKYEESEREKLFNELSDEWLSTGHNFNVRDDVSE